MTRSPEISRVQFAPGTDDERQAGLLGYLSFRFGDDLLVDGCTVRRTRAGRLQLSFPERRGPGGRIHRILRPTCAEARERLEGRVLELIADDLAALDRDVHVGASDRGGRPRERRP